NISHPLLADVLRQHAPQQLPLINLQMEMVSAWATPSLWGVRPHRGIPQGNEVSSWLGTLFLVQMDVELLKLQRRGLIKFLRYVDDLKVFTKDYKALFGDGELFDTQYLYLVPLLRQTEALAHNDRPKLLALGRRKELHWAARAEAIITLMLFPLEEAHYKRLRLLYEQESSTYVKKAILALYLKAPFATKQSVMKATITEPEEETNRFRKFLWALANSPEHAKPSLKIIGNREKDPARLLVSLHGALQSSDLNVLRQVRQIAQTDAKQATSAASRQAFEQVLQHADSKLANLTKGKAKS